MRMQRDNQEIAQEEYDRQVQWVNQFAQELLDFNRLKRLAEEFGYRLVKKARPRGRSHKKGAGYG